MRAARARARAVRSLVRGGAAGSRLCAASLVRGEAGTGAVRSFPHGASGPPVLASARAFPWPPARGLHTRKWASAPLSPSGPRAHLETLRPPARSGGWGGGWPRAPSPSTEPVGSPLAPRPATLPSLSPGQAAPHFSKAVPRELEGACALKTPHS